MIPHGDFGKLRLAQFLPGDQIKQVEMISALGEYLAEDSKGASWSRRQDYPDRLCALEINFCDFPSDAAGAVFKVLDLPVRKGMSAAELRTLFGTPVSERHSTSTSGDALHTCEFRLRGKCAYDINCEIESRGGLVYIRIMIPHRLIAKSGRSASKATLPALWEWLANVLASEDSKIYGDQLTQLRRRLRAWGLNCLGCSMKFSPSLSGIENGIRERQRASMGFASAGSVVAWQPSWDRGSVCKKCRGVMCGACTKKAIDPESTGMLGGAIPVCPKCGRGVEGIDHLTD